MNREHDAPADRQAPIILGQAPSHAERTRTLVEMHRRGTLCTLMPSHVVQGPPRGHDNVAIEAPPGTADDTVAGFPYGSVVNYALDAQGHPILLTSALAEHTRNFKADARASLFVNEDAAGHDVLALGRVTLLGRVEPAEAEVRDGYLARHPDSRYYVDYRDFAFYRLRILSIRYIGGFGRMSWVSVEEYEKAAPDPTAAFAADVITHMNDDHAEAMVQLCRHPAGLSDVTTAEMKAVDCYGFEMTAATPQGPRFVRLGFGQRVETADGVRHAIIDMLRESRKSTGVSK